MRLLFAALALLVAPTASGQGRLVFEGETVDLGRVAEGETPTHTFRFTNAGDAPAALTGVEAACGCTTPRYTTEAVAPGATGEIAVTYDSAGRPGPFEKAVYVVAEGAEPRATTLRVTGTVVPALAVDGVRLGALAFDAVEADAGVVPAGEGLQQAFRFANVGERPVRIERVEAPAGVEVVFPDRPVFPDGVGGLFVMVEDPAALAEAGRIEIVVAVHTTDAEMPVKTVRVRAAVGPVREVPTAGE